MKVIVWGVGDVDFVTKCNKSVTESEWSPGKPDSTMEETGKERCGVSVGEKIKEVRQRAGLAQEAENTLRQAAGAALTFDSMPDYSLRTARFGDNTKDAVFIDIFGSTVKSSVKNLLELAKNDKLAAKWEELTNDGN